MATGRLFLTLGDGQRGLTASLEGKEAVTCSLVKNNVIMFTLIKIAVAIAIGIAVVNPSFTPKADDASCKCSADA